MIVSGMRIRIEVGVGMIGVGIGAGISNRTGVELKVV